MQLKTFGALSLAVLMLSGCLTNEAGKLNKANVGTFGGAAAGTVIGSSVGKGGGKFLAMAAGGLLGALAGHSIGSYMDKSDVQYHNSAQKQALENNRTGQTSVWKNPDTGATGSVTPIQTYHNASGQDCREYTQTIKVGNKEVEGFGKACRRSDGSWEIVK